LRRSTIFEFLNRPPAVLSGKKVSLRPRRLEDCTNEYLWRTDEELCRLDATIPVGLPYGEFLDRYSIELEYPGLTHTLAMDALDGTHIGECSLFNIDFVDNSTEVGILIGDKSYWDKGYGSDAMQTFVQYIFSASDVEKIVLRTLEWNIRAQKCFEKCGFTRSGTMVKGEYRFLVMESRRPQKPAAPQ
jgi:RimJ/RimL family protein N-acetyltransferase